MEATLKDLHWLHEPLSLSMSNDMTTLKVVTGKDTDFWARTFYHFTHDNGHFGYTLVPGDMDMEVEFKAQYEKLYDQAGLMLRRGSECWIKTGIEFVHGEMNISAVVTRGGFSDWSRIPMPTLSSDSAVAVRMEVRGTSVNIGYKLVDQDGKRDEKWTTFRTTSLATNRDEHEMRKPDTPWNAGVMAASPKREGLTVEFKSFFIEEGAVVDMLEA